ncbi:hypothetical protein JC606_18030 [Vibrio sp. IB15]|uniref:hypothetical protein n=1 Tax=Vibrio sp. IB15 TaxID=2779368 RepID=UPI0018E6EC69|nr:hypothetical protein [Vibrio sp. IB15]MBJ2148259.1 hypothetical protein [Vibrio sp. IB15]
MEYALYYESNGINKGQLIYLSLMFSLFLSSIFIFFKSKDLFIEDRMKRRGKVFSIFMGCFTGLLSMITYYFVIVEYDSIMDKYRLGNVFVTSGIVTNVKYITKDGGQESFDINGYTFKYSHNELSSFFNKTKQIGGPIKNGIPVRVTHYYGHIIKLEISVK